MKKAKIAFIGLGLVLLVTLLWRTATKDFENTASEELVSLRNQDGPTGQFFLGSGQIGMDSYYFYYKKVGVNGFQLDKLRASQSVTIYEEDRQDGVLMLYQKVLFQWGNPGKVALSANQAYRFEFHVPKGTIQKNFRVQ